MYAVTIPPMNSTFFVTSPPGEVPGEVEDGVEIDIVPNFYLSSGNRERSQDVLCVSTTNPKRYKVFKYPEEVKGTGFQPTGKTFGGIFSSDSWQRFREHLPRAVAFTAIPDDDPPEAMNDALRALREAR